MRRGRFRRVLTQDLERAFSWRFAISVLAIVLLMMLDNLKTRTHGTVCVETKQQLRHAKQAS